MDRSDHGYGIYPAPYVDVDSYLRDFSADERIEFDGWLYNIIGAPLNTVYVTKVTLVEEGYAEVTTIDPEMVNEGIPTFTSKWRYVSSLYAHKDPPPFWPRKQAFL
jgi:hypothetical protein